MLKYIKNHMTSIDGIEIYPLISLCIFFIFFILLFVYVFGGGKNRFKDVSLYPMSDEKDDKKLMNESLSDLKKL